MDAAQMDTRQLLFDWIRAETPLGDFQEQMYEASSLGLDFIPSVHPFGTYRMGTLRPLMNGGDKLTTWVQAVYVQFHDLPGDYYNNIDTWLQPLLMGLPENIPPSLRVAHPWFTAFDLDYLSEDFRNPDWGTIFRSLRLYMYGRNPTTI